VAQSGYMSGLNPRMNTLGEIGSFQRRCIQWV
jgi:hypothetical protein